VAEWRAAGGRRQAAGVTEGDGSECCPVASGRQWKFASTSTGTRSGSGSDFHFHNFGHSSVPVTATAVDSTATQRQRPVGRV
jgi:hypothetical protein